MAAVQKDDEQPDLGEVGCLFEGSNWTSDGGFRLWIRNWQIVGLFGDIHLNNEFWELFYFIENLT